MSGQASTHVGEPDESTTSSLTEEEVATIREAEEEQRLTPVNGPAPAELTLDRKFELLKNQRRRRVLRFLMENGEASTTGELAEHVAVLENDKDDVSALTSKERKAAYVGLYQCHLPKMDDYGVIQFNQARGRVELTEQAYQLEEYLSRDEAPRYPLWYLGIAGAGGVLFTVAAVGLAPLPTTAVGIMTILAVGGSAGHQWWTQRSE